ncbi:carboxypeptidase-like regulatory domain-containing protein [Algoriphagus sp. CAU 1675]|uniref:TonB-dependent receptor plug domain-containing protein n=1 Tax=Algoriphagus sp. CAU 1675 TaxID=3032597 RepID=UPI0023DB219C|nr:carboxypeptidase-like regulatory domain-containing protein [Algoriphagus sp. CAU 1675]MDF2158682.1 TonB-dependent receptor [Algoriphagus sp. CAU 1675]
MRKVLFICVALFLSFSQLLAQTEKGTEISGFFPGVTFKRFMELVEEDTPYRFYYREGDISDVMVSLQAEKSSLDDLLSTILKDKDLYFSFGSNYSVFISKGKKLDVNLSDAFFKNVNQERQRLSSEVDEAFVRNNRFLIGSPVPGKTTAVLSGTVSSLENEEVISGAIVFEKINYKQSVTDNQGRYSIELPLGRHTIYIQNLGGYIEQRLIDLRGDGNLDMAVGESIFSLSEVVVNSGAISNITRPEMGVQTMTMTEMKKLPAVLGEVDVLKGVLVLPGVNTVGEASVGFNVRGGAADQNLVLFGESTLFNPSHLFGFFSAVNSDMVQEVELLKAGIPANYGGRLSSVLHMKPKFGRSDKVGGTGGIGLLTSRLSVEGPVGEHTTFLVGARTTYSDWVLNYLEDRADFNASRASFYDINVNLRHELGENDALEFTGYFSNDGFRFDPDTLYGYQNQNYALKWRHYFNDQIEGSVTIGRDSYDFEIIGEDNPLNSYQFGFGMEQTYLKGEIRQEFREKHLFRYGLHLNHIRLNPGKIDPYGLQSIVIPDQVEREQAVETSLFFSDEYEINDQWLVSGGLRYNLYTYLGPQTTFTYPEGSSYSEQDVTGEATEESGKPIKTYHGPEFRFSARYSLNNQSSLKAGVNSMRQNIHLLSNTSVISPTDTWKLSDQFIAPQRGIQYALGYFRNMAMNKLEFSAELYYKTMSNLLDYRSGATIILNDNVEQDVLNTNGRAYGIEFYLKKSQGRLNGSVSYTYARSLLKTNPDEGKELINRGKEYSSNFDQPHHAVLILNYEISKRFNTTFSGNYSTGRPITLPVAKFEYAGSERVYFSDRNAQRVPDYLRLDLSINLEGNHKVNKPAHSSWSLGVYNLLGRSNPYSIYFVPQDGILKGYQLSIFANQIPFITYNFKF